MIKLKTVQKAISEAQSCLTLPLSLKKNRGNIRRLIDIAKAYEKILKEKQHFIVVYYSEDIEKELYWNTAAKDEDEVVDMFWKSHDVVNDSIIKVIKN